MIAPETGSPERGKDVSLEGRILGIDLGSVRIGIAMSDSRQLLASPHVVLRREDTHEKDHQRIADLVGEYGIVEVVVGLPISLTGKDSASSRATKREVGELRDLLEVPVALVDERLSSVEVHARREELRRMRNAARRGGRGGVARTFGQKGTAKGPAVIDDLAAAIILQSFLDRRIRERERSR